MAERRATTEMLGQRARETEKEIDGKLNSKHRNTRRRPLDYE